MGVILNANVLGVKRVHGTNRSTGEVYDFAKIHCVDPVDFKKYELRVADDYRGPLPEPGAAAMLVSVSARAAGGSAFVQFDFLGLAEAPSRAV